MRYSATVAPVHTKLETPQAETGKKIPTRMVNIRNFNFLNKTKYSSNYYKLFFEQAFIIQKIN